MENRYSPAEVRSSFTALRRCRTDLSTCDLSNCETSCDGATIGFPCYTAQDSRAMPQSSQPRFYPSQTAPAISFRPKSRRSTRSCSPAGKCSSAASSSDCAQTTCELVDDATIDRRPVGGAGRIWHPNACRHATAARSTVRECVTREGLADRFFQYIHRRAESL